MTEKIIIPERRNLSEIYFRYDDPETGITENRTFEDLPKEEQNRLVKKMKRKFLEGMVKDLAGCLREMGDAFDIWKE